MTKQKALVVGCSMTRGHGLKQESQDPQLWVNQLFVDYEITNLAQDGANNYRIFTNALSALRQHCYDLLVVGWSAIPRWCFHAGLELYTTHTVLRDDGNTINLNSGETFSSRWLGETGDRLRRIQNDHWDFLDLVRFVNALDEIQRQSRGGKLAFVNTLGPWCNEYFTKKTWSLPSELDEFEQQLYSVHNRDDEEIKQLYEMVHADYCREGGIQEPLWINLYQSLQSLQIDNVSAADLHPGYRSQQRYAELFQERTQEVLQAQ